MKTTFTLTAALLAAFTLTASAKEYDLRKLVDREFSVGTKYQEVERETGYQKQVVTQQGNVLQDQLVESKVEMDRTVEVLGVDATTKKPNKLRFSYKSASIAEGEKTKELAVEGLVVVVDSSGDQVKVETEAGTLPPELKKILEKKALKAKKDSDGPEVLLPEKPVAFGAKWEKDPKAALESIGIPGELDPDKSSVKCELKEGEGGRLHISMAIQFSFTTFNGVPCGADPMVMNLNMVIAVEPEGEPFGTAQNKMTMAGKISQQGVDVEMDMKNEGNTSRLPLK